MRPLCALLLPALQLAACTEYDIKRTPGPEGAADSDTPRDSGRGSEDGGGEGEGEDSASDVGEGLDIGAPVDVVLLVDIAYWYDCYHPDLAINAPALINALFDTGEDVAVAIATYDDYNVDGEWWGAYGGRPYDLLQQMTTSRTTAAAAAATLEMEWGGDGPGSAYEALLQASEGLGYDQDCDGSWDSANDVRPFRASGDDAFDAAVSGAYSGAVEGTGTLGGVGFRAGSRRVMVLFAENQIRDAAEGHDLPHEPCPSVAGRSGAVDRMEALDIRFLGVNSYEYQAEDPTLQEQLEALAEENRSRLDLDGDGTRDDPAVLSGSWDWPATGLLVSSILTLAGDS